MAWRSDRHFIFAVIGIKYRRRVYRLLLAAIVGGVVGGVGVSMQSQGHVIAAGILRHRRRHRHGAVVLAMPDFVNQCIGKGGSRQRFCPVHHARKIISNRFFRHHRHKCGIDQFRRFPPADIFQHHHAGK